MRLKIGLVSATVKGPDLRSLRHFMEVNVILRCTRNHPAQDPMHGVNMRVHNPTKKKQGDRQVWRCTVCGKERAAGKESS